jgi:methyl-accepting chemotaxis protein
MRTRRSLGTFRIHLAVTAALGVMSFAFVAAVLTFVPLFAHFDSKELGSHSRGEIAAYLIHLHESFWPVIGGAVLASVVSGMVLFQRMRSPLSRFASVYRRLAEGETPGPIRIRALDYLQDEADELNRMVVAIRQRTAEETRQVARIEEALCELDACELEPKGAAAIAEIRDSLAPLRRTISEAG